MIVVVVLFCGNTKKKRLDTIYIQLLFIIIWEKHIYS
jgi:hypothetical protein